MSWRVAQSLLMLRDQINEMAPQRSIASDGTIGDERHRSTNSDHNPHVDDGGVGVVTALDITDDPDKNCDCQSIVDALVKSRDPRIKYIIWNKQIVSATVSPWIWRKYEKSNPHTKHFHLSVKSQKHHYDSRTPWTII